MDEEIRARRVRDSGAGTHAQLLEYRVAQLETRQREIQAALEARIKELEEEMEELGPRDLKKRVSRIENAILCALGTVVMAVAGGVYTLLGLPKAK